MLELPFFNEDNGDLVAIEGGTNNIGFSIERVFNVRAQKGQIRGRHAHRNCSQLLICTNGEVEVRCDSGTKNSIYILDKPNSGLLISPKIWSEQKYIKANTILTVLCDQPFDENDYIRDYDEFLKYIND
jgi:dTDP-4-dehydrorhamnose 3,5-epimerase-like enzyme